MENQAYIFLIFILNGFLVGLLFDIFRILRKSFKTNDFITCLQDILFWIIAGLIILFSIFKFNNGELRGFIFIGIIIGGIIYLLLFSKIFIKVNMFIINIIKKVVYYVVILPLKTLFTFLKKIFLKPISIIFINFRKIMPKFKIKYKNCLKKDKKEKDLT